MDYPDCKNHFCWILFVEASMIPFVDIGSLLPESSTLWSINCCLTPARAAHLPAFTTVIFWSLLCLYGASTSIPARPCRRHKLQMISEEWYTWHYTTLHDIECKHGFSGRMARSTSQHDGPRTRCPEEDPGFMLDQEKATETYCKISTFECEVKLDLTN